MRERFVSVRMKGFDELGMGNGAPTLGGRSLRSLKILDVVLHSRVGKEKQSDQRSPSPRPSPPGRGRLAVLPSANRGDLYSCDSGAMSLRARLQNQALLAVPSVCPLKAALLFLLLCGLPLFPQTKPLDANN